MEQVQTGGKQRKASYNHFHEKWASDLVWPARTEHHTHSESDHIFWGVNNVFSFLKGVNKTAIDAVCRAPVSGFK